MEKEVRRLIFLAALLGNFYMVMAQDFSTPPPEPTMVEHGTTSTCGDGDGGGGSPGVPPPVGLCLPINNYLLPLLIFGVALGTCSIFLLEKKQKFKISVR